MGRHAGDARTQTYCPWCNKNTYNRVTDSRQQVWKERSDVQIRRRRRRCEECDKKHNTLEVPAVLLSTVQNELDGIEALIAVLETMREDAARALRDEQLRVMKA